MMEESGEALDIATSAESIASQLSEAVQTQVTLSKESPTPSAFSVSNIPPPTSMPSFQSNPSTGSPAPLLLSGGHMSLSGQALPPLSVGANLLTQPINSSTTFVPSGPPLLAAGAPSAGPPPRSGFQPVPHAVQDFESHKTLSPTSSLQGQQAASVPPPVSATHPTGVTIFTPAFDPNAPPSPYSAAPPTQPSLGQQNYSYAAQFSDPQPPVTVGNPHSYQPQNSSVQLSFDGHSGDNSYFQQQSVSSSNTASDGGFIDWFKKNDTVNMMLQKAKTGVQQVITAMDPQMRDVLYSGGDIDILVASQKEVKVGPVKEAFQEVFGRATVNGMDSQAGIAPQPVGYTSGIKGAEERINNLRRSGRCRDGQVCVSIESFLVDLQPEMWYDIACLMLNDPINNITLYTFTQATPVNLEYVNQAQSETPEDYNLSWSGLSVTVGQIIQRQCAIDPSDWHFYFTGVSRRETIHLAAKQLASLYKQRLPYRH